MRLAVLKERAAAETRVAATPETVKKLIALGCTVAVETEAGMASAVPNEEYRNAGAEVVPDDFAWAEGYALGTPTRFGTPSAQLKQVIDSLGGLWASGQLADKAAKPVVPSHPSRIWVQLGVGRDKGALGFDWRKLGKAQADLFKGRKPWTTPWGQTNRLLVGPFETQAAASAFLKEARKKDGDAFVWTSPAGQAVDALVAK